MGIILTTDSWAGLTIMFPRRLPPPCNTSTAASGRSGTAVAISLGLSSTGTSRPAVPDVISGQPAPVGAWEAPGCNGADQHRCH